MVSQLLDNIERRGNVILISVYRKPSLQVNILYKKKVDKVRLVDTLALDRSILRGCVDQYEHVITRERVVGKHILVDKFDYQLYLRIVDFKLGIRLTQERLEKLQVSNILKPQERELFMEYLYNKEATMLWTFEEINRVNKDVTLLQRIQTIPYDIQQVL